MGIHRKLALIDAADQIVDEIVRLATARRSKLLFRAQLLKAAGSVSANVGEGFGRATTADRNRSLVIARGEAEETIRHLRANRAARRVEARTYWRLHNRLVTAIKMIDSIMRT
jgi:four helix bundle protein